MKRGPVLVLWCLAILSLGAGALPAQTRGGFSLSWGYTESEKPAITASYFHRITSADVFAIGGLGFFHPGSQPAAHKDPDLYFASVFQAFAGVQLGEMLYVQPRIALNWYGPQSSVGWGIAGGFSFHVGSKVSLGLVAAHDRVRFDNAVDAYGPSPFTSIAILAKFWFVK